MLRFFNVGPLHSLVVRLNGVQEVVGSNPAGPREFTRRMQANLGSIGRIGFELARGIW
jgi:hypothetical protein